MSGTTLFSSIQNMQSCYLPVCNLHVSNPARTQGEGQGVTGECAKEGHQGKNGKPKEQIFTLGCCKTQPSPAIEDLFKTTKILVTKVMWNLRHLVSFFFNCWVEEGDEQGFQDFYKKAYKRKKGTIVTIYNVRLESNFLPLF